jgi:hypothetical protein
MSKSFVGCVAIALVAVACARTPATRITTKPDLNALRWNATLSTPDAMRGIVQARGSAELTSTDDGRKSRVDLRLENMVPGGEHPWALRSGQCGVMGAMGSDVLRVSDGRSLKVGTDGKASAGTGSDFAFPSSGDYHVIVLASKANSEQVIACGNFAPPNNGMTR